MSTLRSLRLPFRLSLSFVLLVAFLFILWGAGGASRADVAGQVVVRGAAMLLLIVAILFARAPSFRQGRAVMLLLAAALVLVLAQLVPLPPSLWQALPGRGLVVEAGRVAGLGLPWRPLSLVPGATANAAASLVVPVAALVLAAGSSPAERRSLPGVLLVLVGLSTLVGLLQFSGAGLDNPLVNDTPGQVSGLFANRNHFALFLAFGCLLAPAWAFQDGRGATWRVPAALGLVLLFVLAILASGSRAGLVLGVMALLLGLAAMRREIRASFRRYPRWFLPALIAGVAALIASLVLLSVLADRAVSIDRALTIDPGQDMRRRGLPTVLAMIRAYFPAGTGLGSFDPLFRIHEPFGLLKLTYFNHAHNDFLEILLDAGLPGLLLMVTGLAWWGWAGVRAWSAEAYKHDALPRLGSALLLLLLAASVFDYPARTPMMMAIMVLAGLWLEAPGDARVSALRAGR